MSVLFNQEIEKIEAELLQLKKDRQLIEKEMVGKQAILNYLKLKQENINFSLPIVNDINSENSKRYITLVERVDNFISTFNETEFTSNCVYEGLKRTNIDFDHKTSKASISGVLFKFAKQGKIKVSFKGSGRIPSRYRKDITKKYIN